MPSPTQDAQSDEVPNAEKVESSNASDSSLQKTDNKPNFDDRLAAATTQAELDQIAQEQADAISAQSESQEQSEADGKEGEKADERSETDPEAGDAAEGEEKDDDKKAEGADKSKESEKDDEDEDDTAGKGSKQIRTRIADGDKVGALATVILKGNNGRVRAGLPALTLKQAMAQAERELGLDKVDEAKKDGGEEESTLPKTVEATDAEIARLRKERTKAWTEEVDVNKAAELEMQIDALKDHRSDLREKLAAQKQSEAEAAKAAEKTEQVEYDSQFDASKEAAVNAYDFVSEPESEAAIRMLEIDAEMEQSKDPTFHDPNKPLIIAQMAAREFRIAPKKKGEAKQETKVGVKPVTSTAKPVVGKPVVKSVVASGASRTAADSTQVSQRLKAIDDIKSVADLEKFGVGGLS